MTPHSEARLHRVIARASVAVLAVGIGAGTAGWTWYPTAEASPAPAAATKTVAWLTDVRPGVTTPVDADDVMWPQPIADIGSCGDGWLQVDTYSYDTPRARHTVDALTAAGVLYAPGQPGSDSDVILSWYFVQRQPCVTPSSTPTDEPTPTDVPTVTPSTDEPTVTPTTQTPSSSVSPSPSTDGPTPAATTTAQTGVVAGFGSSPSPQSAAGPALANTGVPLWGWLLVGLGIIGLGGGTLAVAAVVGGADDRFDVLPDEDESFSSWLDGGES